jgi:hypothetical protein
MENISVHLEISEDAITFSDNNGEDEVVFIRDKQSEEEYEIIKFLLLQLHGKGVYGQGEKRAGKCIMARANSKFGEGAVSKVLIAYLPDE